MRKFLKVSAWVLLCLLIAAGIGGYWFIKNFDLNKYKDYVAKIVEEQTGRKFAVNGEASLGISLVPTLIVEDVELANAPWASQPQMVTVEKLELKLAIMPLLKKQIVLDKILLINPQIYLEVNSDGMANWEFAKKEVKTVYENSGFLIKSAQAQELAVADKSEEDLSAFLKGFSVQNASIVNGMVVFDNQKTKSSLNLGINELNLSMPSFDENIVTNFDLVFNGQDIKGKATIGSLNQILSGKEAFPLLLDASAYGVNLDLKGSLAAVLSGNPSFNLDSNIYNPAGNFGAPETTLIAKVQGNAQKINVNIDSLNVVNNLVTGNVSADLSGKVPSVKADLQSAKFDLTTLQPSKPLAFSLPSLISAAQASALVPNTPVPYAMLNAVNADVTLQIGDLIISNAMSAQNVAIAAVLKGGVLNVNKMQLNFGGGEIDAKAVVNAKNQSMVLNALSKNMLLQNLHKEFVVEGKNDFGIKEGGSVDVVANLQGKGTTYRDLVNSLDGQVIVIADKSVVQTGGLSFMTGNFITEILNALNFNAKKVTDLNLNCAVVRADITDGKVNFPKGIAVSSDQLNLVSSGDINLLNDKINFTLRPFSGKVVDTNVAQAISSFIAVKGTLQNPKITLDDKEALSALVGIAATGGTSYLGSKMLLDVDNSPCYTALQGTQFQNRFPKPTGVVATGQDVYQDTTKAIKDDLNNLKNSAKDILKGLGGAMKGNK